MSINHYISDELLAAYIDGTTDDRERLDVSTYLEQDSESFDEFRIARMASNMFDDPDTTQTFTDASLLGGSAVIGGGIAAKWASNAFSSHPHVAAFSENSPDNDRFSHGPLSKDENERNNMTEIHEAPKAMQEERSEMNMNYVHQEGDGVCAVKCQQLVLDQFGIHRGEDELTRLASKEGWLSDDSTTLAGLGNILDHYNVPVTCYSDANILTMTHELSRGHQVIASMDSRELWEKGFYSNRYETPEELFHDRPDHAIIVAGIDTSDPKSPQVVLTDTGAADHRVAYPLERFMETWKDSAFYMISTDQAAPPYAEGMCNFDYTYLKSLPNIGGLPFPEFEVLCDLSMQNSPDPAFFERIYNTYELGRDAVINFPEAVRELCALTSESYPSPYSEMDDLTREHGHMIESYGEEIATVSDYYSALGDYFDHVSDVSGLDYSESANWYAQQLDHII